MESRRSRRASSIRVLAAEGATVPVDAVVAWIGRAGEAVPDVGTLEKVAPVDRPSGGPRPRAGARTRAVAHRRCHRAAPPRSAPTPLPGHRGPIAPSPEISPRASRRAAELGSIHARSPGRAPEVGSSSAMSKRQMRLVVTQPWADAAHGDADDSRAAEPTAPGHRPSSDRERHDDPPVRRHGRRWT